MDSRKHAFLVLGFKKQQAPAQLAEADGNYRLNAKLACNLG